MVGWVEEKKTRSLRLVTPLSPARLPLFRLCRHLHSIVISRSPANRHPHHHAKLSRFRSRRPRRIPPQSVVRFLCLPAQRLIHLIHPSIHPSPFQSVRSFDLNQSLPDRLDWVSSISSHCIFLLGGAKSKNTSTGEITEVLQTSPTVGSLSLARTDHHILGSNLLCHSNRLVEEQEGFLRHWLKGHRGDGDSCASMHSVLIRAMYTYFLTSFLFSLPVPDQE